MAELQYPRRGRAGTPPRRGKKGRAQPRAQPRKQPRAQARAQPRNQAQPRRRPHTEPRTRGIALPALPALPAEPEALRALRVVPDVDGPHVRLGLLWAVVTFPFALAGPLFLAPWMALNALVAAGNVCRSFRRSDRQGPVPLVAVFGAALLPLAAVVGPLGVATAGVVVTLAAILAVRQPEQARPVSLRASVVVPLLVGLAAASPVLLRVDSVVPAFVLLLLVCVYDASVYVVGSGSANAWEGPTAGVAFVAAVTLAVAAVFVPPFRGVSPWVLGLLAAVLAPVGPYVGSALLSDPSFKAPGLRRLDSLLVRGPLWAVAALLML